MLVWYTIWSNGLAMLQTPTSFTVWQELTIQDLDVVHIRNYTFDSHALPTLRAYVRFMKGIGHLMDICMDIVCGGRPTTAQQTGRQYSL